LARGKNYICHNYNFINIRAYPLLILHYSRIFFFYVITCVGYILHLNMLCLIFLKLIIISHYSHFY